MDTLHIGVNGASGIFNDPMPAKCDTNSNGSCENWRLWPNDISSGKAALHGASGSLPLNDTIAIRLAPREQSRVDPWSLTSLPRTGRPDRAAAWKVISAAPIKSATKTAGKSPRSVLKVFRDFAIGSPPFASHMLVLRCRLRPDLMTSAERLDEVARLLALGFLRLQARRQRGKLDDPNHLRSFGVDFAAERSVSDTDAHAQRRQR